MIIYTLPRLKQTLVYNKASLLPRIRIGGRLEYLSGEVLQIFSHQNLRLSFLSPEDRPPLGSKVILETSLEEILKWHEDLDYKISEIIFLEVICEGKENSYSDIFVKQIQTIKKWNKFISKVRYFFDSKNFEHIATPFIVESPGLEPTLEPFSVNTKNFGLKYLPTSPEFHLKKSLCRGLTDIYEIKTCFRDNEESERHFHEFLMLEWYRAFSDLSQIEEDMKALIESLLRDSEVDASAIHFEKTSVRDLFKKHLNLNLSLETSQEILEKKCQQLGFDFFKGACWDDLFHILFLYVIEPELQAPTFVYDFPPSQAALARINKKGWAERFEFYWKGLEIANAFDELTDSEEQLRRFKRDQKKRVDAGLDPLNIDFNLINEMRENRFPFSGGIALGLERLYMALYSVNNIRDLKFY